MTHETIMEQLNEIFRDVFDDDNILVKDDTTAYDIADWDSLMHITLIEAVEQAFGMRFRMQEVSGMKNVGEMAEIVMERAGDPEKKKKKKGLFRR